MIIPLGLCQKERYPDKRSAQCAKRATIFRSRHPKAYNAYPCAFCGGWHVGHLFSFRRKKAKSTARKRRKRYAYERVRRQYLDRGEEGS